MTDPIVDIPGLRIQVSDIQVGDIVRDVYGGTYTIVRVTRFRHVTRFTRNDGWVTTFPNTDTITIRR
jgi:hypothetical protein